MTFPPNDLTIAQVDRIQWRRAQFASDEAAMMDRLFVSQMYGLGLSYREMVAFLERNPRPRSDAA